MRTDRRTKRRRDGHDKVFRNFANAPKTHLRVLAYSNTRLALLIIIIIIIIIIISLFNQL
jgi:hypothetical protein